MSRPVNINETVTFNPTGYANATNMSENTSYPWTRGYNSISNTSSYARLQLSASSTSTDCYIYYTFSVSDIPSNATITNVSCVARIYRNNRVTANTAAIQLYNGTTAKGGETNSFGTTASNVTISNTGSWTVSELNNIRLRIKGRRSSTNNSSYIYFYGANLSITYSVQGTEYEIISTLATNAVDSIDPAGQTWVFGGDSYELDIFTDSSEGIEVTDNGVNVTALLEKIQSAGDSSTGSYNIAFYNANRSSYYSTYTNTSDNAVDGVYNNNVPANGIGGASSTTRACVFSNTGSGVSSWLSYDFDLSAIPANAIISSVTCSVKAAYYSASYFNTHEAQLYTGNTAKGTSVNVTGTGSSGSTHTIDGGNSWTRSELNDINVRYTVTRGTSNTTAAASFSFYGATLSVTYATPNGDYFRYVLSNVNADHTIIISDSIIEIPDEDPEYNYYPITVSSINATTEPGRGTIRVVEGSNQTITIYPDDPSVTLVTDNGVDISNQMVQHGNPIPDPTVTTASGASYGFSLNNSTGYYVSQNAGVDKSAAVCVVHFNLPVRCLVTMQYINYAEAIYDFGIFGNIDVPLNGNYKPASGSMPDSDYKLACNTSNYNSSSVQTITYEIPSGEHDIYIKYSKDDATSENNDTLQFKISDIQELESNNYYTYTLSNIQEAHSLIFIFGDVTYYLVNSSGTNARLFPSGSMVQLPGDVYLLTVVPDDYAYSIAVTDNGTDVTSFVERKEEQITKEGVTTTVVNYIYTISNIQATHNIVVSCFGGESLYIKISGTYVKVSKIWKKIDDEWDEVALNTLTEPAIFISKN